MLQGRVRRVVWGIIVVLAWSGAALAQNGRVGGLVREDSGQPVKGATVAVQGFGNVGSVSADLLAKEGCKVVAISDRTGAWYNPKIGRAHV